MSRLSRASALQFGVRIANTGVGAVATIYFVNELGVGTFGQYVLVMAVVNWATVPSVGVRASTMKRISEGERRDQFFTAGLVTQLVVVGAIVVPVLLASGVIAGFVGVDDQLLGLPVSVWLAGIFVSVSTAQVLLAAIRGEGRIEVSSVLEGVLGMLRSVAQFGFVFVGFGLVALLGGELLAGAAVLLLAPLFATVSLSMPSRAEFASIYEYGRYAWVSNFKTMSYSWMDTIVLGLLLSQSSLVGTYEVAWRISAFFVILPASIGKTVFPKISELSNAGEYAEVSNIIQSSFAYATMLSIPGFVGALVVGRGIIGIYGIEPEYAGLATLLLVVLSLGRIAESYELLLLQVLNSLDRPDATFRISLIFIAANLSLNLVLVWTVGAIGAAVSTALSILLGAVLLYRALPADLTVSFWNPELGHQFVSAVLMGILLQGVLFVRPLQGKYDVLAYVVAGGVIYFTSLAVLSPRSRDRLRSVVG